MKKHVYRAVERKESERWTVTVEVDGEWSAEALATELDATAPDGVRVMRLERITDGKVSENG